MSATYTAVHGNAGSLTHWVRSGIKPTTSWFLVRFVSAAPWWELQEGDFKWKSVRLYHFFSKIVLWLFISLSSWTCWEVPNLGLDSFSAWKVLAPESSRLAPSSSLSVCSDAILSVRLLWPPYLKLKGNCFPVAPPSTPITFILLDSHLHRYIF